MHFRLTGKYFEVTAQEQDDEEGEEGEAASSSDENEDEAKVEDAHPRRSESESEGDDDAAIVATPSLARSDDESKAADAGEVARDGADGADAVMGGHNERFQNLKKVRQELLRKRMEQQKRTSMRSRNHNKKGNFAQGLM